MVIAVPWNGKVVSPKRDRQIWWDFHRHMYDYNLVGVKTHQLELLKYFTKPFSVDDTLHHRDNAIRNCIFIRDN